MLLPLPGSSHWREIPYLNARTPLRQRVCRCGPSFGSTWRKLFSSCQSPWTWRTNPSVRSLCTQLMNRLYGGKRWNQSALGWLSCPPVICVGLWFHNHSFHLTAIQLATSSSSDRFRGNKDAKLLLFVFDVRDVGNLCM